MSINAVSTLEIEWTKGIDAELAVGIRNSVAELQCLQGCHSYTLTESAGQSHRWLLSGYWLSEEAMDRHFASVAIEMLLISIGNSAAAVRFGSFSRRLGEQHGTR
ncbi:antibiotic biosynthesis monooxygenase [Pseudomonas nitroreducens]|uniref:antibiotic biosynthesis monooxygenase n=1 Tax=Pseudomonas nitroreducens TaxID=46680 RepID=UPI00209F39D9|nr:antibiotic biosynthesis monooxygenase [Pseudomonas nitroreducens]MCP1623662.1 quinol monooxygenase YgiN [Pseudomonas nitroreducens]